MSSLNPCSEVFSPNVVVVGGGPVGLWTAIQTKLLTGKEVLVVEKYLDYKRADIRLNIDASSLGGIPNDDELLKLAARWSHKAVPIKEMEEALTKRANEIGVKIVKGKAAKPAELQKLYPTAKVFIGADGARSSMRKEIFGDQYLFNQSLQHLIQVQYLIKTPEDEDFLDASSTGSIKKGADSYKKMKFAGHLITENVRDLGNGQSQVSLRIFIDEKTYKEMADATFSNPYYFETDLEKVPEKLKDILIKWWGSHETQKIIAEVEKTNKITVIPLAAFAVKSVVKVTEKEGDADQCVVNLLVGDAAQAYPYFRAINNGLMLGTKLAKCAQKAFAIEPKDLITVEGKRKYNKEFASKFTSYSRYSTFRAYIEYFSAVVKNAFINVSRLWMTFSGSIPVSLVKMTGKEKERCYQQGISIWNELSKEPVWIE